MADKLGYGFDLKMLLLIKRFTLYKLPTLNNIQEAKMEAENPFLNQGTAYSYITNTKQSWQLSSISMNDTESFAGKTLEPLYQTDFEDPENELGFILYNDQADKVTVIKGHTKGVIVFNKNSVVWIVHSIPHFPPKPSSKRYAINTSQCVYGQSMMCVSLGFDQLAKIADQLYYTYPQVYDSSLPQFLRQQNPDLFNKLTGVINGKHVDQAPWFKLNYFTTIGGESLLHLAKFTDFAEDLYSGLVATNLRSNLYAETWNNGRGTLPSNCSSEVPYHVYNIEKVKLTWPGSDEAVSFSVHHDHSKWTVTTVGNRNLKVSGSDELVEPPVKIACIGDINRQEDQFKRSGGTFCFMNNLNVWQAYSGIVDDIESCKNVQMRHARVQKLKDLETLDVLTML